MAAVIRLRAIFSQAADLAAVPHSSLPAMRAAMDSFQLSPASAAQRISPRPMNRPALRAGPWFHSPRKPSFRPRCWPSLTGGHGGRSSPAMAAMGRMLVCGLSIAARGRRRRSLICKCASFSVASPALIARAPLCFRQSASIMFPPPALALGSRCVRHLVTIWSCGWGGISGAQLAKRRNYSLTCPLGPPAAAKQAGRAIRWGHLRKAAPRSAI